MARRPPPELDQTIIQKIALRGFYAGQSPALGRQAREWFRQQAAKVRTNQVQPGSLIESLDSRFMNKPKIGWLYLFNYDPKWKEELPYYDTFPLVFPIGPAKKGFLGINMHYLPPQLRAILMENLLRRLSDKRFDTSTHLQNMAYQDLIKLSRYKAIRPCIKHYLWSHVRTRFVKLYASEWPVALFLPLARFKKAHVNKVYADSRVLAEASTRRRRPRRRRT